MEVSIEGDKGIRCDVCDYPRRGIGADARCPECGAQPPELSGAGGEGVRTKEELIWLRTTALGLWLLIGASLAALQVALIIPAGELSIGTVNFPGPKIHAAAMVQRSIGGQPGPWGVSGIFWSMGTVLGVWFITERRAVSGDFENALNLRSCTRWIAVSTAGGVLGLLLSWTDAYVPPRGAVSINLFAEVIAGCELPSNLLLYLYLRRLSQRIGDRRSLAVLNACVWGVPAVSAAAVLLLAMGEATHRASIGSWRLISIAYGCAALTVGIAATAAVARLAVITTVACVNFKVRNALVSLPQMLGRACTLLDLHRWRYCFVAGLLLLLLGAASNLQIALSAPARKGLAGEVPMLNFPGPKVLSAGNMMAVMSARASQLSFAGLLTPAIFNLLGIWLVTGARESAGEKEPLRSAVWRRTVRWAATVAVAGPMGFAMSRTWPYGVSLSRPTAWVSLLCEAPATCLLYLYLAGMASGPVRQRLRLFSIVAPVLIVAPMSAFALSRSMRPWHSSVTVGVVCGVFMAVTIAASLTASFAIGQLGWEVGQGRESAGERGRTTD
jgi:hypothetical protein